MGYVEILNWVVFCMGCVAMCFSAIIGLRFVISETLLSKAVGLQILAEFVALAITNFFAYISLINEYNAMGPRSAAALRIIIFCTSLFTSLHLYMVLHTGRDKNAGGTK